MDFPLLKVDKLRFEIFKYFYGTHIEFDLYKKADSSEFFQCILDMLHFCLNPLENKVDVDSKCDNLCEVHSVCHLKEHV